MSSIPETISKSDLISGATTAKTTEAVKLSAGSKSYQFPSAPCAFEFQKSGKRVPLPEGVYTTSDADELAELDKAVSVGNIYPYSGKIVYDAQVPPKPVSTIGIN